MSSRRRGRSDSMIKLLKERKESKLRYDEAISHGRAGNYEKALKAYNRASRKRVEISVSELILQHYVSIVTFPKRRLLARFSRCSLQKPHTKMVENAKRTSRLDTNRDSELFNRFVRMNLDENEEISDKEEDGEAKSQQGDTKDQGAEKKEQSRKPEEESKATVEPESRSRKTSSVSVISQSKPTRLLAKMINQELKKKKKRHRMRSRKHDEIYTDKDRAAAMSMGSKDIKTSLKVKHRQERSKALSIPEEAEPGNFIALGSREKRCGKLKLAIGFYSKALELNPQEKNALVARSQCNILMGRPDLALKDAEEALAIDKTYIKAIYQKAESLYYSGEFEHSLVYYHRGLRIRPDLEGFQLGVNKAQRAIENAIGSSLISREPTPMADGHSSMRTTSRSTTTKRSKSSTGASSSQNRLVQMPKQLRVEMRYLDGLSKHPDIKCQMVEDTELQDKIKEAVDYLNTRQTFWKQQLPPKIK